VYFSFYLFEVLKKFERPDLLLERLSFWKDLRAKGFKTPVEKPEPSRSDCHAWGAHPLYHFHASLSGIRPATPGFQSVLIAPQLGSLSEVHSRIPHPRGYIEAHVTVDPNSGTTVSIHLPNGIAGIFLWKGEKVPLRPGDNAFSIASD
jgi:hypothetical protein